MAYAGPGQDISAQLVVDADIAMYQAKRKGGDAHQIIDSSEARQTNDRNSLEKWRSAHGVRPGSASSRCRSSPTHRAQWPTGLVTE